MNKNILNTNLKKKSVKKIAREAGTFGGLTSLLYGTVMATGILPLDNPDNIIPYALGMGLCGTAVYVITEGSRELFSRANLVGKLGVEDE